MLYLALFCALCHQTLLPLGGSLILFVLLFLLKLLLSKLCGLGHVVYLIASLSLILVIGTGIAAQMRRLLFSALGVSIN